MGNDPPETPIVVPWLSMSPLMPVKCTTSFLSQSVIVTVKSSTVTFPEPLCLTKLMPVTLTVLAEVSMLPNSSSEYEPLMVEELLPLGSTIPALYSSERVIRLLSPVPVCRFIWEDQSNGTMSARAVVAAKTQRA